MENKILKLAQKLANVMSSVTRLKKTGRNEFHKYDYATNEAVVDLVRGALAEEGVCFIPSMVDYTRDIEAKTPRTVVRFKMTFTDGTESIESDWVSEAADASDKGINKAATSACKYFFMKTFLISAGEEDPDRDSPDTTKNKATVKTPPLKTEIKVEQGATTEATIDNMRTQVTQLGKNWEAFVLHVEDKEGKQFAELTTEEREKWKLELAGWLNKKVPVHAANDRVKQLLMA